MSEQEAGEPAGRTLWKGLVAGAVAGLVATAAKSLAERMFPPRTHGEPEPPEELSEQLGERLTEHGLSHEQQQLAAEGIHWGFGAVAGAAYGALAEFYPAATAKEGASFGVALGSLMHEGVLPAMGLSADPEEQTLRERTSEFSTHVVFGVVAEGVRKLVRRLL